MAPEISEATIAELGRIVGHTFKNRTLIVEALTHSSAKTGENPSNERLEFFGDAVLGLAMTEMIYHDFPEFPEGEMTRAKSSLVSREMLARKAFEYGFQRFIVLGKGVGIREELPRSMLANVFEAILAALYLDAGYTVCMDFLRHCFRGELAAIVTQQATRNYKSALQQLVQSHHGSTPVYTLLSESGPDHNKRFTVAAVVGERQFSPGEGSSKKEAEQVAALMALKKLLPEIEPNGDTGMLIELPDDDEDNDEG